MKVALTVKNTKRAVDPQKGDVLLFDGSSWYVTTKDEILRETNEFLSECKAELEAIKAENSSFRVSVAGQMLEMSELIRKLYSKEGE